MYCSAFSGVFPSTAPPGCVTVSSRFSSLGSVSEVAISRSERAYLEDGISASCRLDGRALLDYRPLTIETNILPSASGSSRVRTADAELVVGIKCEVHRLSPTESSSSEGIIRCSVDCSPLVNAAVDEKSGQDASRHLAHLVDMLILNTIDRSRLCIAENALVWKVYVDVVVLTGEGNLLDAVGIGIRSALSTTILPEVSCVTDIDEETGKEKVDYVIDERPEVGQPFPAEDIPICVTAGQIRSRFVWDLSPEENACAAVRFTAAIDSSGRCRGIHKTGTATMAMSSVFVALQNSCHIANLMHQRIKNCISDATDSGVLVA